MAAQTHISWCDATFNPWEGCQKVSPACDNCYAEARNVRFHRGMNWGPGAPRRRTAGSNWAQLGRWNADPAMLKPPAGTKPFVFGGSLCDPFDNAVEPQWRRDYFDKARAAENLVILLLTKRPQNIKRMVEAAGGLPPNVALGTTVEDKARLPNLSHLLRAADHLKPLFTFGSFEPLLEDLGDLSPWLNLWECDECGYDSSESGFLPRPEICPLCAGDCGHDGRLKSVEGGLGWMICGGESGPNARPAAEDWFLKLEYQADHFQVPFDFKQRGGRDKAKGGDAIRGKVRHERPQVPV